MNIKKIDEIINEMIQLPRDIVLFGAGDIGRKFTCQTSIKLPHLIYDNDTSKCGKKIFEDFLVTDAENLKGIKNKDNVLVLILSHYDKEISNQVESYGFNTWLSICYLAHKVMIEEKFNNIGIKTCMIETSNLCNAKCPFCINSTMSRKKMNMTDEIFEWVLYRLKESNQSPEIFRLHCLGEPLIDPELFQKIRRLKSEFPKSVVGYTSNFSLATEKIVSEILECGQDFLTISINTNNREDYQKIMGLNYDQTIKNIDYLLEEKSRKNSNLEVTLSIVENEKNYNEVLQFSEYWKEKGVNVRALKEGKWVEKGNSSKNEIDISDDHEYCCHILSEYVCQQLYQEICILSNGDYALCCFDGEGCLELGNVKNTNIYDVFHDKKRMNLITAIMNGKHELDICMDCSFRK